LEFDSGWRISVDLDRRRRLKESDLTSRKATGGKTVYGARVGILMLDTRWPRVFNAGLEPRDYGYPGLSTPDVWRER
jgi:hypothetical protein